MPVLEYQLCEGLYSDAQIGELLRSSSHRYAQILECPIERVRVTAHVHKPQHVAVAGRLVSDGAGPAPYFQFLVLDGRSLAECQQLIGAFTDLLVEILHADRRLVRGGCWPISPAYWGIGGQPASVTRAVEITTRAENSSDSRT
jgi:phenylpyruvate tautomerase PptA (4-oxalocrotonate tautomerase family)